MTPRWRDDRLLVPIGFLAIAALAFRSVFRAFFLSDDFAFLQAARTGEWIWPKQLYGTFFRPFTLLSFRVTDALFGLRPLPYHLTNVLLHVGCALAIYGIARAISGRAWPSAAGGAVFLVFAGHGEAVSWISGRADVLATFGVLGGLFSAARALARPERALPWWTASTILFAAGLLSKESAAVAPALVVLLVLAMPRGQGGWRPRAAIAGVVCGLTLAVMAARWIALGVPLGRYGSFGLSHLLDSPSLFVYRALLPGQPFPVFTRPVEAALAIFALLCGGAVFLAWRRRDFTAIFAAAALLVSLLPVMSLSISLVDIQSERLVYMATAFGAMLTASVVTGVAEAARAWPVGYLALAVFCAANLRYLRLTNARFADAGGIAERFVAGVGEQIARAPAGTKAFILNLPDTHYGIYVLRNGLSESMSLFHPALFRDGDRFVLPVAREVVLSPTQAASITVTGPASFHVDLTGPLAAPPVSSTFARVDGASASGYDVTIRGVRHALALYVSGGTVHSAGLVSGNAAPFGVLDVPAERARCDAGDLRFAGWVLFSGTGGRVTVQGEGDAAPLSGDGVLGQRREDIQAVFPGFRDALHAGWEYRVRCDAMSPGSTATLRVVASDDNGSTTLGTRTIRRPGAGGVK
jgi:hypothetical protein